MTDIISTDEGIFVVLIAVFLIVLLLRFLRRRRRSEEIVLPKSTPPRGISDDEITKLTDEDLEEMLRRPPSKDCKT